MSAPYPPQPQRDSAGSPSLSRKQILLLVAAGAGAMGYLLGFVDDTAGVMVGSIAGFSLVAAAVLAALRFVPRTPNGLFASAPLSVYAALALLQQLVRGTAGGLGILLMLLAVVQCAAVLAVLLAEGGVLKIGDAMPARPGNPAPFPPQAGGPRGPGGPNNGGWPAQGRPGQNPSAPPAQPGPPNPPWAQQPGQRPPSSDGVPIPGSVNKPDQSENGGPRGTRQMPHPGANPPNF